MNAALSGIAAPASNAGVLGAALGESAEETEARLEEARKTAKDLTGLVRKKNRDSPKAVAKSGPTEATTNGHEANGKRRAEEPADGQESKKARVEDVLEG